MQDFRTLVSALTDKLERMARANAVVAKPVSVGDRHVVPLCELAIGFGAGGGEGEGEAPGNQGSGKGVGMGAGGGAKATPVAFLVVEGHKVRLEKLGS